MDGRDLDEPGAGNPARRFASRVARVPPEGWNPWFVMQLYDDYFPIALAMKKIMIAPNKPPPASK